MASAASAAPRAQTAEPVPALARALKQDKEVNELCPILKELDREQDVFSAALQMIKTAADAVIGITS